MFDVVPPPPRLRLSATARLQRDSQTLKPIALALRVVLTSLSSCRWFTARRPAQTRTRSPEHAVPPADNSTGCITCSLSSFQRTDACQTRKPAPGSTPERLCEPFLGEPSKVTTAFLPCQLCGPAEAFSMSCRAKKIAPFWNRSNSPATRRVPPAESNDRLLFQYTRPGWVCYPFSSRRQRLLAEQALPSTEPRARYLTNSAAAYVAYMATINVDRSIYITGTSAERQGTGITAEF